MSIGALFEPRSYEEINQKAEFLYLETGLHLPNSDIAICSGNTIEECLALLDSQVGNCRERIVILPELITCTSGNLAAFDTLEQLVQTSIEGIRRISGRLGDSYIVFGTPDYSAFAPQPRNAAYVAQYGQIVGKTYKTSPAFNGEAEDYFFDSSVSSIPFTLRHGKKDFGVLICSDAVKAKWGDFLLERQGLSHLSNVDFVSPSVETLCVISAWGIGSAVDPGTVSDPNLYYLGQQRATVVGLFHRYKNLQKIVFADRTFDKSVLPVGMLVSTKPLSSVWDRSSLPKS